MALKKRIKVEAGFHMSSMTDIIFLLLLFFIMASTLSSPNDIKLNLPQSKASSSTKSVIAKVTIDAKGNYFVAKGNNLPQPISPDLLESYILNLVAQDTTTYIALHADKEIAYKEVVKVLDIANQHKLKLVIATQTKDK
ncbi:MAG: biopolymer transporter ExbD [Paludibacter sp.]|nr:biopolymer transporter ExbD [Paludibacter sp.]